MSTIENGGMTTLEYAAIHFAAAWLLVINARQPRERDVDVGIEANRLGMIQAHHFLMAASAAAEGAKL